MQTTYVPLTEEEATTLLHKSHGSSEYIPLTFGAGRMAIAVDGSAGSAWALRTLAVMRGLTVID